MHIRLISHLVTLFWQRSTSFCIELLFISRALDEGGSTTNLKYLGLTQLGIKPMTSQIECSTMSLSVLVHTLYTVPKAPDPMIPPRRSSDSFIRRKTDISGLALVGVHGCKTTKNS